MGYGGSACRRVGRLSGLRFFGRSGEITGDCRRKPQEHARNPNQLLLHFVPVGHSVEHAVIQQILGALESFGQLLPDRLFHDPGTGETDQRIRFGNMDIAQHGI